ncbi:MULTISPECIES: adenylate kinase [unclassified Rhizobium]|jgi:adenylate kinase family enzyme|uniref:adenylate kinase n=1 Tax=unclassified Rhizobium TaxID=2613769 RepID=UPI000DE05FAE|nr:MULTISPECIES: adenylate kinase [unclassified Rhizobium]MBB3285391.1 adenylate kinase family enzyme [Rhizobium sp. BK252]MBB3400130.1 adenylate kinase family enzyme [Rhizobium sp. BK289]MBB3412710.1 adenylate kinase family enzyme [Rhizobium sp. BK284]MBB3480596.1 adenylate kinase family enzyme [Rhizobium sp. BK347]MDK4719258.1 adenylate kinase [Rhizobium sp. CNPSo 3968]
MLRVAILGNAGGGKSTLARRLGEKHAIPHFEIDTFLWREGWVPAPLEIYTAKHERIIAGESWVIDGLGHRNSIQARIDRATEIILVDMPLWMHFWLAAERQIAWQSGKLEHAPGGLSAMPPTRDLFRTIWEIEQDWMPDIRRLCTEAFDAGKRLTLIHNVDELNTLAEDLT